MSTSYVVEITDATLTDELTALVPPWMAAGTGLNTPGTERRRQMSGTIHRLEVFTESVAGGVLEIWDVEGDIDQSLQITNAHLAAEITAGRARLIYSQQIAGSAGAQKYGFATPTTVSRGLAARWKEAGGDPCKLNVTVDGTFVYTQIRGA